MEADTQAPGAAEGQGMITEGGGANYGELGKVGLE